MKILDYIAGHAQAQIGTNTGSSTAPNSVSAGNFTGRFNFASFSSTGDAFSKVLGLVVTLINWFLVIVGIIAFIYIVIYGIKYITSGGDAGKATEARNGIINAIIGLIVITLAFFIIGFATSVGGQLGK